MCKKYKSLLFCALVVLVTMAGAGCSSETVNPEEIYSQFQAITEPSATARGILEATAFLDGSISGLGKEDASYLLLNYEDYLARFINSDGDKNMVQQLSLYYDKELGAVDESRLQDQGLLELAEAFREGNIYMTFRGTSYTLLIDYTALAEEYEPHILEALYDLYLMKGRGTENPVAENAALVVDFSRLAEMSYQVEQLIREHKEEAMIKEDALYWYSYYNNFLLLGANNTPIFDYGTGRFSQEAKEAYESFAEAHPDSATAWLLTEYLTFVEENGYERNYSDGEADQAFLAQCSLLTAEAEKRVYQ